MNETPNLVVCMGVSGSGKSSLATTLADNFGLEFLEADDFHSTVNKERMAAGEPLQDTDRAPWMADVCAALLRTRHLGYHCVLAHSALRRAHRNRLREIGFRTLFLHLQGAHELIARRVSRRSGHFMPAQLVDSQFKALEDPRGESDVFQIDIDRDAADVAATSINIIDRFLSGDNP